MSWIEKKILFGPVDLVLLDFFSSSLHLIFLVKVIISYPIINEVHKIKVAHACYFDLLFTSQFNYLFFVILTCTIIFLSFLFKNQLLFLVAIFILSLLYFDHFILFGNGSDFVFTNFLFLNLFIGFVRFRKLNIGRLRSRFLIRIFLILLVIQLGLIYAYSGIDKLNTLQWRNGESIFTLFNSEFYLIPSLQFDLNKTLVLIISWLIIGFEISFILLIFNSKFRFFIFSCGMMFHLVIAFLLTIPDFGLIMICGYLPIMALFPEDLVPKWLKVVFSR